MHASGILSVGALVATAIATTTVDVTYDPVYDDAGLPLTRVACSDGDYGLITRYHWETVAEIPGSPYVGGAQAVAGWNSSSCGTCWRLEHDGHRVHVLAVDHAVNGFNIGTKAMTALASGYGIEAGRVRARAHEVDVRFCGL